MDKNSSFDWVTARSECSLVKVFEALKLQVGQDVKVRNSLLSADSPFKCSFVTNSASFSVTFESPGISDTVKFERTNHKITVEDTHGEVKLEASLTLNDDGKCRLKTKEREYELWQFRKLALEELLFGH